MSQSLGELRATGEKRLAASGNREPRLDARLLLQHVAGLEHAALISADCDPASPAVSATYEALLQRRMAGEPVSRIVGWRSFFGLRLMIAPDVLDPRPETELLVETALAIVRERNASIRIVDAGTGSGAIAIALLKSLPNAVCTGVDISPAAMAVAQRNAADHGVADRFHALLSNYLDSAIGPFDLIVSNPPYIKTRDIAGLQREVCLHDPVLALDGGTDGLGAYRILFATGGFMLAPGGSLVVEFGAGQAAAICQLANECDWRVCAIASDLAGIERVATLQRK